MARKSRYRDRRGKRGIALVDMLVASMLLCIGIMGLVGVYSFSFNMTVTTDDMGIGYNLGRQSMENTTRQGFTGAVDGTTTTYYNGSEVVQANQNTARYQVVNTVATVNGLRTVTVVVSSVPANTVLYQTNTYLVQAGI
jgi:Tfp pilus assembly protein PilV